METTIKYNIFEIDENLSMGENGFLYYKDFMEKNAYNRIILSTILNLHKKGYAEVDTNKKNIIEFIICFIIFFANYYILKSLNLLVPNVLLFVAIETIIILIYAIKNYINFMKIDILSNKAISTQQNLQSLANFLKDYSLIENRKSIEIHLWDIYLILSVLLNINKTITKELKFEISDNNKNKKKEKQFDFYENKYFYINDKNEKIYID